LRAWLASSAASWEESLIRGESNLIQVPLTGVPNSPLDLIGLQPWTVNGIPEPSSAWLALIGFVVAATAKLRRRQR
jgi:hypothetical protein